MAGRAVGGLRMSPRARRFFGCVLPLAIALAGCGGALMLGYAGQVFIQAIEVDDAAMAPLIEAGSTVIVDNTVFWDLSPGRGVVVSVASPEGPALRYLVGLPGDTVELRAGRLVLDGVVCDGVQRLAGGGSCWFAGQPAEGQAGPDFGPLTLGPDDWFVLAQRFDAPDSRVWGPLRRADIFGAARFSTRDMRDFDPLRTPAPPRREPRP